MTAQAIKEPEMYDKSLPLLLADPRIGSLMLAPLMGPTGFGLTKGQRILDAVKGATKPVIMTNLNFDNPIPSELIAECRARGVPYFTSPDRALRAIAAITQYARALARPEAPPAPGGDMPPMQALAPGTLQLSVTAMRDPEWGPLLEIGFGGNVASALPATIILPPDLEAADIAAALDDLPGAILLTGRDRTAASAVIARIGAAFRADATLATIQRAVAL
jgi:acyl-CoA synthetase (NDP forming)